MSKKPEVKRIISNLLARKAIREDIKAVGGVGLPSKMPGTAYGLSAKDCGVGGQLAKREGTVCSKCYAMGNNYAYPSVVKSHEKRKEALKDKWVWIEGWCNIFAFLGTTLSEEERYHRWHDSGDVQDIAHLHAIVQVAERNPEWRFWLPSKEYGIMREYMGDLGIPSNLAVRMSMPVIGQAPRGSVVDITTLTSTVGYDEGFQCPAYQQEGQCGDCRTCWDVSVANVNYPLH